MLGLREILAQALPDAVSRLTAELSRSDAPCSR